MFGGFSIKNNIWTRGFAIAFVILNPVFETFIGHRKNSSKGNKLRVFDPHWRASHLGYNIGIRFIPSQNANKKNLIFLVQEIEKE
jgi:hypothetical protein